MNAATRTTLTALLLALTAVAAPALGAENETPAPEDRQQLLSRIDFGNAYVMGQSIKSGAVYLLNRKRSDIESMLDYREDFRKEIREDAEVLDRSLD